jgi:hypothetical protein
MPRVASCELVYIGLLRSDFGETIFSSLVFFSPLCSGVQNGGQWTNSRPSAHHRLRVGVALPSAHVQTTPAAKAALTTPFELTMGERRSSAAF